MIECNCGAYVPADRAVCPGCGKVVRTDLFDRLRQTEADRFDRKMRECEERFAALASARISPDVERLPLVPPDQGGPDLAALVDHLPGLDRRRGRLVDPTAQLRARMEEWNLDPDMGVEDLLDLMEEYQVGVDLWTSPKRWAGQRYRCRLYILCYGRLELFMEAEAQTVWAALTAAVVSAFEQEWLDPE